MVLAILTSSPWSNSLKVWEYSFYLVAGKEYSMPVSAYQEYSSNHLETTWGRLSPKNIPMMRRSLATLDWSSEAISYRRLVVAGCNSLFFVIPYTTSQFLFGSVGTTFGGDNFPAKFIGPIRLIFNLQKQQQKIWFISVVMNSFSDDFQWFQPAVHFYIVSSFTYVLTSPWPKHTSPWWLSNSPFSLS